MSVYNDLTNTAASDPKFLSKQPNESDQQFLRRLVEGIGNVSEDDWAGLSEAAQQWFDASLDEASGAIKLDLVKPDGYPEPVVASATTRRRPVVAKVTVYDSLVKTVTAVDPEFKPQHPRELDNTYLTRLLNKLGEDVPANVLDWVTDADAASMAGQSLPLPEGYVAQNKAKAAVPAPEVKPAPDPEPAPVVEQPKTSAIDEHLKRMASGEETGRRKKTVVEKPEKIKKAKIAKAKVGRQARPDSTTALIRDAVTRNPSISVEALETMLKGAGKETSTATVTTTRASHIAALRSLERCGWQAPALAAE